MSPNLRGALIALLAFAAFATHDTVVKVLGGGYSPIQLIFFSTLLSFPLAILMIIGDARPGTLRPVHPWWIALRTGAGVLTALSAFYAFSVLPLAQVYTILFASPLLVTILSIPILGERVRIRRWLAVIVGLLGVVVVLRPGQTDLSLGHAAALLAACGGSTAAIIVRKIGGEERPIVLLLYPMLANFILMGAALAFVYQPMPIQHLGLLACMSILGWTGGRLIVTAYSTGEAVIVAPMQYSQILWATAFGMLFFGETLSLNTAAGAAIIIASGLYIVLRESRSGSTSRRPVLTVRPRPDTGTTPKAPQLPEGPVRVAPGAGLRGVAGRTIPPERKAPPSDLRH